MKKKPTNVKLVGINLSPKVCPPVIVKINSYTNISKKYMRQTERDLILPTRNKNNIGLIGETNRSMITAGGYTFYHVIIISGILQGKTIYCLAEELTEIASHCSLRNT